MINIKLLGIETDQYIVLKKHLSRALKDCNLKATIEEVIDVNAILKQNVQSIPAILINGEEMPQNNHLPTTEEITTFLKDKLSTSQSMKTILVPTDFSEAAQNAFIFAQRLAEIKAAKIQLLHVVLPYFDPSYPGPTTALPDFHASKKEALLQFQRRFTIPKTDSSKITVVNNVESSIIMGAPAEEIVQLSKKEEIDIIIMGTTGESGALERLFGSVSSHVSRKAYCPVILIPNNHNYTGFKNIMYATDFLKSDEWVIPRVTEFATKFAANLHLVHVDTGNSKQPSINMPNYVTIKENSVTRGLNQYTQEHSIDLLVLSTPHRNLFQELFHKSTTKKVALNTDLPLMVIHTED